MTAPAFATRLRVDEKTVREAIEVGRTAILPNGRIDSSQLTAWRANASRTPANGPQPATLTEARRGRLAQECEFAREDLARLQAQTVDAAALRQALDRRHGARLVAMLRRLPELLVREGHPHDGATAYSRMVRVVTDQLNEFADREAGHDYGDRPRRQPAGPLPLTIAGLQALKTNLATEKARLQRHLAEGRLADVDAALGEWRARLVAVRARTMELPNLLASRTAEGGHTEGQMLAVARQHTEATVEEFME
jgi:hypothetical protein